MSDFLYAVWLYISVIVFFRTLVRAYNMKSSMPETIALFMAVFWVFFAPFWIADRLPFKIVPKDTSRRRSVNGKPDDDPPS